MPSPRLLGGLLFGLLVAGLLWVLAGRLLAERDATWARIRQTGAWRVGMDPSFPPFETLDAATGQPVGFDVDLARAIAERWGVRVELIAVGFDQLVDAVAIHRVDSAVSALPVMEHRAREVAFSAPYFEAGIFLVAAAGGTIGRPEDLAGKRIAVEWGSEGDAQARLLGRRLNGALRLALRETAADALAAVLAGDADAAVVDAISLALFDGPGRRLTAVGEPLRRDPYVILMPADAPWLRQAVNEALADFQADGTLARLRARWLGD
jgi:ABC-type amino acid transport substrate-binding protein